MDFGPIFIDHIGIATENLDAGSKFWELLGLQRTQNDERVEDQGVTTRFFSTSIPTAETKASMVELLEPTHPDTPVGRFLDKRGQGIQQLCFSVANLQALLDHLDAKGIRLINRTPTLGAGGKKIAFVHPSSTGGVLVELSQRR